MKEKRRISADGYFEVSSDGGKSWTKTTSKPSALEIAQYKAFKAGAYPQYETANKVVVPAKGIAAKYNPTTGVEQFTSMTPKDVTLPVGGNDMTMFNKSTTDVVPQNNVYRSPNDIANVSLPQDKKRFGNIDMGDAVGTGLAALQTGYGLQQLLKDKRPIGKLDPTYNQLTNEAIAQSRYGYTPAQKSLLQQQIIEGKNADVARINNLAGGNAAVGLANSRAALNNMYSKNLQLASEDERLRMQKAQYAGAMAGNRANMSRQLFGDNMNAFMQKQQAGSELLSAGLQNIVSAKRYQQEKLAQNQINKLYGI